MTARTQSQIRRQDRKYRDAGRYAKVNPCYRCGRSAGEDYQSDRRTDDLVNDEAICLCRPCFVLLDGMSDEQFLAEIARPDFRQNIDFRTDLYTTGLTVFEYSAQLHPLAKTRNDLITTISRAIRQPPRPLRTDRPEFSAAFCALVDQMLKKKPMLRPSNLAELIAAMEGGR